MQAILSVKSSEIDEQLLSVIKELLSRNVEVVIKNDFPELEEFDRNFSLDEMMRKFEKSGYSKDFLSDLKKGFETSEIYVGKNENKTAKK